MKMFICYDGEAYAIKAESEINEEQIAQLYDGLELLSKMQCVTTDGSIIILGKQAIESSVFIFRK